MVNNTRLVRVVMATIRKRWVCLPTTGSRLLLYLFRSTRPIHALVNTPLCILTLILGYRVSPVHSAPAVMESSNDEFSLSHGSSQEVLGPPVEGEAPGYRFSYDGGAKPTNMYEGIIICLLAVTAFIGLVVWVLKSNFEERQTRRMRREASLRDRNSNVSPLMTPDSEES